MGKTAGVKKWQVILLLIAAALTGLATRSMRQQRIPVRVAVVSRSEVQSSVRTTGTVVPEHEFEARSAFSGIVQKIHVQLGQKVSAGQLLVSIRDPFAQTRIDAANVALQSAEVAEENVQNNGSQEDRINFASDRQHAEMERASAARSLAALRALQSHGDATQAEVTAAQDRLNASQINLDTLTKRMTDRYSTADQASWKARVKQARSGLEAERENFSNVEITSPIAGTVYLIPVAQYDFVPSGADLMRVADLSAMVVHANFDEPDIGKLHDGQPVTFQWDGRPGYSWHGHILHAPLAVVTDGQRRVGECTISVDTSKQLLPAQTTVMVSVTLQDRNAVLTIPREALHSDGRGSFVYKVVNGKLLQTPVVVGVVALTNVEVIRGLQENDVVALEAMTNTELADHLPVQAVK